MGDAGFFRGTSADQDNRFSDKQKKLLKQMRFSENLNIKIDWKKVNLEVLKPWIVQRVNTIIGFEDDVLLEFIFNQLEDSTLDPKTMQINLTGFLDGKRAREFMGELWQHCIDAQNSADGIPPALVELKKQELQRRIAEEKNLHETLKKREEKIREEARDWKDDRRDREDRDSRREAERSRDYRSDRFHSRDYRRRSRSRTPQKARRSRSRTPPKVVKEKSPEMKMNQEQLNGESKKTEQKEFTSAATDAKKLSSVPVNIVQQKTVSSDAKAAPSVGTDTHRENVSKRASNGREPKPELKAERKKNESVSSSPDVARTKKKEQRLSNASRSPSPCPDKRKPAPPQSRQRPAERTRGSVSPQRRRSPVVRRNRSRSKSPYRRQRTRSRSPYRRDQKQRRASPVAGTSRPSRQTRRGSSEESTKQRNYVSRRRRSVSSSNSSASESPAPAPKAKTAKRRSPLVSVLRESSTSPPRKKLAGSPLINSTDESENDEKVAKRHYRKKADSVSDSSSSSVAEEVVSKCDRKKPQKRGRSPSATTEKERRKSPGPVAVPRKPEKQIKTTASQQSSRKEKQDKRKTSFSRSRSRSLSVSSPQRGEKLDSRRIRETEKAKSKNAFSSTSKPLQNEKTSNRHRSRSPANLRPQYSSDKFSDTRERHSRGTDDHQKRKPVSSRHRSSRNESSESEADNVKRSSTGKQITQASDEEDSKKKRKKKEKDKKKHKKHHKKRKEAKKDTGSHEGSSSEENSGEDDEELRSKVLKSLKRAKSQSSGSES